MVSPVSASSVSASCPTNKEFFSAALWLRCCYCTRDNIGSSVNTVVASVDIVAHKAIVATEMALAIAAGWLNDKEDLTATLRLSFIGYYRSGCIRIGARLPYSIGAGSAVGTGRTQLQRVYCIRESVPAEC